MSDNGQNPFHLFGSELSFVRFQSTVTEKSIDKEDVYECTWCDNVEKRAFHVAHRQLSEVAV